MSSTTALDKSAEIHEALAGSPLTAAFAVIERLARNADEAYNGWKNYPTWAVNLWLSNDESLYREALRITEQAYAPNESKADVIDALRDWVRDDLSPDLGASFAADLLGYALDSVDWVEIADAWLEV